MPDSQANPVVRQNIGKKHFCKHTDKLKLYVPLCVNFPLVVFSFQLVRFRHNNNLVRVRTTSCFGLKYLFGRHKHGRRLLQFKISSGITVITKMFETQT